MGLKESESEWWTMRKQEADYQVDKNLYLIFNLVQYANAENEISYDSGRERDSQSYLKFNRERTENS